MDVLTTESNQLFRQASIRDRYNRPFADSLIAMGADASLAGLTFVALALEAHQIERTRLLQLRASNALSAL